MSELPPGWTLNTLGDIATEVRNGISAKPDEKAGLPILRISSVRPMRLDASDIRYLPQDFEGAEVYRLAQDDLLFTRYNGNRELVGACARVRDASQRIVYPDKLIRVRLNRAMAHPAFVEYAVHSSAARQFISEKLKTSAGQIGISGADLKRLPIPIAPLNEQRRIADKLDRLLAAVDTCKARLDAIPAILKRFRQSVLAAATSGALTEEWRGRVPANWNQERAADLCEKVQSGGTPREGFVDRPGIPFLKVYNIIDQEVSFEYRPQFVEPSIHAGSMAKSRTLPGDVLMNIVGPPLGKVAIVPDSYPEWNINQAITLFRPSPRITSKWLYYVLCSGRNLESIIHQTKGMVGQVNISLSQCRDFVFPVPRVAEQAEIVRRVDDMFAYADRVESRYFAARGQVDHFTSAVLAKAFRGELVSQGFGKDLTEALQVDSKSNESRGSTPLQECQAEGDGIKRKRGAAKLAASVE